MGALEIVFAIILVIFAIAVIAVVLLAGCYFLARSVNLYLGVIPGALIVLIWGYIAFFFRNPKRTLPENPELLLSPADGVVRDAG